MKDLSGRIFEMANPMRSISRRSIELWLLLSLVFFLPIYEAPKNIFWLLYVVAWVLNRQREGNWGGGWDGWDSLIATWIASGYVVALFAGTDGTQWAGATDLVRYGSVLWCLRRSGYTDTELSRLGATVVASCSIALAWGFWRYYVTAERVYVELHSVGHVNHSAPYLAICVSLILCWLFASWPRLGNYRRILGVLALAFILAGLLVGASRAAIGAMVIGVVVVGVSWLQRSSVPLKAAFASLAVLVVVGMTANIAVVEKQRAGMQRGDQLSQRGTIWNRAIVAWQANPWFGVGIDNFGMITDDMLRRQVEGSGKTYVPERYRGPNHAHSLYFNTLAERGSIGFLVFATAMIAWAATLLRGRPRPADRDLVWTYWGASLSTWIIIMGAGVFNTTLHHEIAILAMLVFGSWMATQRPA